MGCTSCHDPHETPVPEQAAGFYRDRCLSCHQETSCGLPQETRRRQDATDQCVRCHMPKLGSQKAVHVSDTDHRILRRPMPAGAHETLLVKPGEKLLIPFHPSIPGGDAHDLGRDLGLALVKAAEDAPALVRPACSQALPLLEEAVRRRPQDAPAWQAKGKALKLLGLPWEGLRDLRHAVAAAPNHEAILADAATLAGQQGERVEAKDYWRRAIAINPWSAAYHTRLAELLHSESTWTETGRECRLALRLDPLDTDARVILVSCLIAGGDRDAAQKEFETLMALKPPNPDELRKWFAERLR